jgi:cardiolipin synthase
MTVEKKSNVQNGIKRLIFVGISLVLEVLLILSLIFWLESYAQWIEIITRILALLLVLFIYNMNKTASMKMPWIILILLMPILGTSLYLLIGLDLSTRTMRKRYVEIDKILFPYIPQNKDVEKKLLDQDKRIANIAKYIHTFSQYPVYDNCDVVYYDDGLKGLEAQKEELKKAEKFIFMEYHAIENAESWHGIQEILEDRVKAGVDVRVFYDDMGSIGFINTDFVKLMEDKGIKCRVFNPFKLGANLFLNNRDHRKVTVVDGRVGFTGGYNLANEYFHLTEPFGFWKDTGVKITGPAVKSLTVTFLEMWNACEEGDENDTEFDQYFPNIPYEAEEDGFIIPYADMPIDQEQVGEDVYISVAEYAQDYAWYVTPYLILTDEMTHALGLAAKRGVDVRIITPGIPDKKIVYSITRSYYNSLVKNGVRIFEYTPGFCHAKMSIADDKIATCGTINLDYRSLYHHFENGCLLGGYKAVGDIHEDFEDMFNKSREVTKDYMNPKAGRKFLQLFLRLFAPLM